MGKVIELRPNPLKTSKQEYELIRMNPLPRIGLLGLYTLMAGLILFKLGIFTKGFNSDNTLLSIYVIAVWITFIGMLGEESDSLPLVYLLSFIPGINSIFMVMSVLIIVERIRLGCWFGHYYEELPEKSSGGHCRMGGFTERRCKQCDNRTYERWSAF